MPGLISMYSLHIHLTIEMHCQVITLVDAENTLSSIKEQLEEERIIFTVR